MNMSNPGSTGLFARAQRENRLCAVAMNDVQFLAFHQSTQSAIGTEGLSGCSVVMVTSQHGAILAHIPPRPSMADPQDQHAGDQNAQALMSRVASLYTQQQTYFPITDTFLVCAVYAGDVALPDQKRIIEDNIFQLGLSPYPSSSMMSPQTVQIRAKKPLLSTPKNIWDRSLQFMWRISWYLEERSYSSTCKLLILNVFLIQPISVTGGLLIESASGRHRAFIGHCMLTRNRYDCPIRDIIWMLETAEQEINNSIIQQANMLGWSTTTGKNVSSRYFNLLNLRATNGLSVGSVRSKDSQMRQPWRNSPPANERSWSGESSLNHYTLNGCARNSPTKPFDAMSLTPPASPETISSGGRHWNQYLSIKTGSTQAPPFST